jgi:ABC-type lipoprotein release transport system permease subunit
LKESVEDESESHCRSGGNALGLTPTDPLTLISIAALVICIALASCYVPASRAVRVNPQVALKCD